MFRNGCAALVMLLLLACSQEETQSLLPRFNGNYALDSLKAGETNQTSQLPLVLTGGRHSFRSVSNSVSEFTVQFQRNDTITRYRGQMREASSGTAQVTLRLSTQELARLSNGSETVLSSGPLSVYPFESDRVWEVKLEGRALIATSTANGQPLVAYWKLTSF